MLSKGGSPIHAVRVSALLFRVLQSRGPITKTSQTKQCNATQRSTACQPVNFRWLWILYGIQLHMWREKSTDNLHQPRRGLNILSQRLSRPSGTLRAGGRHACVLLQRGYTTYVHTYIHTHIERRTYVNIEDAHMFAPGIATRHDEHTYIQYLDTYDAYVHDVHRTGRKENGPTGYRIQVAHGEESVTERRRRGCGLGRVVSCPCAAPSHSIASHDPH